MEFSDIHISDYAKQKISYIYDCCRKVCKTKHGCLLLDMIASTQNVRESSLRESSIDTRYLDKETIDMLCDSGLAYFIDSSHIGITAKGILYVEYEREIPAMDRFIESVQTKYFSTSQNTPISPKGRILLLSAVALRCFSKDCSIDLRAQKDVREEWWEILLKTSDFLVSKGIIDEKNSLANYSSKSEIEDKASDVIRHSDKLPRQTEAIFSKSGSNQYWLKIAKEGGGIDTDSLALVIKKILGENINLENYNEYADWCNNLCLSDSYKVESSFSDPCYLSCDYDDDITKAFEKAAVLIIG